MSVTEIMVEPDEPRSYDHRTFDTRLNQSEIESVLPEPELRDDPPKMF